MPKRSRSGRFEAQIAQIRELQRLPPAEAIEALTRFLHDRQPLVVQRAADALGALGHPAAIEPLVAAYERAAAAGIENDPGCRIRQAIVKALGDFGGSGAVPLVRKALHTVQIEIGFGPEDTALGLRATAALALARLVPADALYDLALLLFDEEPNVAVSAPERPYAKAPARKAAARGIGSLGQPEGVIVLAIKLRYPRGEVPEVLAECLDAMAALRPPQLLDLVQPYLVGPDPFLATTAATALAQHLGREALPILVGSFERVPAEARVALVMAVSSVRSEETGPVLLQFTGDPDPAVRLAAVEGAALYPDAGVQEYLRRLAASDPDAAVRQAAAAGLRGFGS